MTPEQLTKELVDLKLLVGLPTYDGRRHNGLALWNMGRRLPNAVPLDGGGSLLAKVFNEILCDALQRRDRSEATHFLLMHDDIVPVETDWFGSMWKEFRRVDAEMMAAVVPIKDGRGLTSTGLETENNVVRRLTLKECDKRGPTFTDSNLLLNSGLLLFDLRCDWVNSCYFHIDDKIHWHAGKPYAQCMSEDWNFTRMARAAGAERIYATTAVKLVHMGRQPFPSYGGWGLVEKDDGGV